MAAVTFDLMIYPAMLLTETFYLFLMTATLLSVFATERSPSWQRSFLAGVLLGLSALTRAVALGFLGLITAWRVRRESRVVALVLVAGAIVAIAPWTVRNYKVYGEFPMVSAGGGVNFWIGNYHGATGESPPTPEVNRFMRENSGYKIDREGYRQGLAFILEYPGEFAKLVAMRFIRTWSVLRTNGFHFHMEGAERIISITLSAGTSAFLLSFGLAGFWLGLRESNPLRRCLDLYALSAMIPLLLFFVSARYRLPLYPALIVYAAAGAWKFWEGLKGLGSEGERRKAIRVVGTGVLVVLLATSFDAVDRLPEVVARFRSILSL